MTGSDSRGADAEALARSIARFQDRLATASRNPAEASHIHSLRIAIRRLRISLAAVEPGTRKSWLHELRPLFRAGGRLRDLHIQRELVARLHPPSLAAFNRYAMKMEPAALEEARQALKAFRTPEQQLAHETRTKRAAPRQIQSITAFKRLRHLTEELRAELQQFSASWTPERIHALRIKLKRFRYTLDLLDPRPHERDARALLTVWQDRLGEVQDLIVLRQTAMLGNFYSRELAQAIDLRRDILLGSLENEPALLLRKQLRMMQKSVRKKQAD